MANVQNLKKPIVFTITFSTYTATAIIGEGGSGRIYRATDEDDKANAIKLLEPSKITRERIKRFKNELNFCQKNQHQNILTVYDHGTIINGEQGSPFYVMPLFDGSLRDLMQSGIPVNKVLEYFAQTLDGVEAAHKQGIIHRDLKPENILYATDGDRLVVADFGIAHFEEDDIYTAVETKDTARLANFQYAAPEQRSRGSGQNQCTDIFALGLILNEMFTGEIPSGTGYKTITEVAPEYEYLDVIVEGMIRQSPQDRPDSIEKIKMQLIGRKKEFVTRQRVSELKGTVVPVSDIDDPLINDPLKIVEVDWDRDVLTISFQQPVNQEWVNALNNMGSRTAVVGKGPEAFQFRGNKAVIGAREHEVQLILGYFKEWLPTANSAYERSMRQFKEKEEQKQRKELERQIEEQEARQRVLKNIKLP